MLVEFIESHDLKGMTCDVRTDNNKHNIYTNSMLTAGLTVAAILPADVENS